MSFAQYRRYLSNDDVRRRDCTTFTNYELQVPPRSKTTEYVLSNGRDAESSGRAVNGVKGVTPHCVDYPVYIVVVSTTCLSNESMIWYI